ncbi:hypothetical protein BASA62_008131 [Batrachochytrium salamandrivorans]|nr:hypothetical protein BASA62_008131 [Batrachochytrium salamandrivorans]
MKLISFAIISLLAITASAQSPHGTATQDMDQSQNDATQSAEQPQSTTTQSEQQSDQDKAQAELKRLVQVYKNDAATLHQVENKIEVAQRKTVKAMHTADMIKAKLQQTGLDSEEKLKLEEQYNEAKAMMKEFTAKCNEQYSSHVDAKEALDDASAHARLLKENQRQLTEYNDNHEIKMEPSPGSFYNLPILKAQYDEILKKIETLHGQEITIRDLGPIYVGNNLEAQLKELIVMLQPLRLVSRVESYKYLGVLIDSELDHSAWLKQKRSALEHTISALHPVLANHQLTVNYRSRIFSAVVMGKVYYGLELIGGNKSHLAPLQTTIDKGIRLFTSARLSTAIGPFWLRLGIGSLLTRSLVSRSTLAGAGNTGKPYPIQA